jgi:hypothetical protein
VKLQKLFGVLAVVAIVIMMMVLFVNPVGADTLKLGPKWVDGHSYDGQYGVNNKGDQSWGFGISYDIDGVSKIYSKHQAIGIDYGAIASYYHITVTDNKDGRDNWTLRDVNSLVAGVYPKFWYELHGVRAYIAPIVGYELADDGESAPMAGGMIGVEKMVYKNIGINLQHEELWTMKRRFDTTSLNLMYKF